MVEGPTAVFLSYAHADNEADGGRIIRLAERVRSEMTLLTSDSHTFFVDRDSIEWGNRWRMVIDTALSDAPFLLAIITPRYFKSPECRRELLAFHREAQGKDLGELVLPILYVPVTDLSEASDDEAVAIVAQTQYVNWTFLRLAEEHSAEYRSAIHSLATRLIELISEAAQSQLQREVVDTDTDDEDLESLLAQAEQLWPVWLSVVAGDEVISAQSNAISDTFYARRERLRAAHVPPSAVLAAFQQQGIAELPLVRQKGEHARVYSARTIELDPIVWACIKAGVGNPSMAPILRDLQTKVSEAVRIIESSKLQRQQGRVYVQEFIQQMPFVNQTWKEIRRLSKEYDLLIGESNELVLGWHQALFDVVDITRGLGASAQEGPWTRSSN